MNLLNLRRDIINKFTEAGIEQEEAVAEVKLLFEKFLSLSIMDLYSKNVENIDSEKIKELLNHVSIRLEQKIPVQYLIGYSYFYGLKFLVNKSVLIPRKDSEILVKAVLDKLEYLNLTAPIIADIGTGSGCIAIAIASKEKKVNVIATDISEESIQIAISNAKMNNQSTKISFIKTSLLDNVDKSFDIICSNPPYIPIGSLGNLPEEVRHHEPRHALFVDDSDPLKFYREISLQAINKLNPHGYLIFEIDSPQNDNIRELLNSQGWKNITTLNDYNFLPRVIIASL